MFFNCLRKQNLLPVRKKPGEACSAELLVRIGCIVGIKNLYSNCLHFFELI